MPRIYKCSKCGKEVPFINTLYHYKHELKASVDFCTECFDVLCNSLTLKIEYVENKK